MRKLEFWKWSSETKYEWMINKIHKWTNKVNKRCGGWYCWPESDHAKCGPEATHQNEKGTLTVGFATHPP